MLGFVQIVAMLANNWPQCSGNAVGVWVTLKASFAAPKSTITNG